MTIEEVVRALIGKYGSDVLKYKDRFITLFQDYSNNYFSLNGDFLDLKACYDNGLWKYAKNIYDEKDANKLQEISRDARKYLVDKKRLSSTSVISGINILLRAFEKDFELLQIEGMKNEVPAMDDIVRSYNDDCHDDCSFIGNMPASSKRWFLARLSEALAGNVEAMLDIASCYRKGNIVQKNWRMAQKWYRDVIENNNEKASVKTIKKAKEELIELYNELDESCYR